ncbi:MAG: hypothetical protein ACRDHD_02670 [Candidatus Limnocylindria bacterium]
MDAAPVELTADPRFARRIRRLAATSLVALGLIWVLAVTTLEAGPAVDVALAAGWVLMPAVLFASLARPRLRYGLVVPASLVGAALLAICVYWLPDRQPAAAGWLLITIGVAMGGGLGLWFWYRLAPVPAALDDPFSTGRWVLVGTHIGLIVLGIALAGTSLV